MEKEKDYLFFETNKTYIGLSGQETNLEQHLFDLNGFGGSDQSLKQFYGTRKEAISNVRATIDQLVTIVISETLEIIAVI